MGQPGGWDRKEAESVHWTRVRALEDATFVIYDTPRSRDMRDSVVPSSLLSLAPPHPCLPTHPIIISNVSLHGAAYANFVSHM